MEKHYKMEIDRKKRAIESPLKKANDDLEHHRHQAAFAALKEGKDLYVELASDDKFQSSNDLQSWLKECQQRLSDLSSKIDAAVSEKANADKKHKISSLVNDCTNALDHRVYEKYLESVAACNDQLQDVTDEAFVAEIKGKLDSLQAKYVDEHAKKEIDNAVRKVDSLIKRAFDQFDHFNDAAALQSFEEAQASAAELNGRSDLSNVQRVKDFFEGYAGKAKDFKQKYSERTQKKEVDNAVRDFNSAFNAAKRALDQSSYQIALEKSSAATDALAALCEVDGGEHKEDHEKLSKLKSEIMETSRKREINSAQSSISRGVESASNFLERYNPSASIGAFEKAKDEFANFKDEYGCVESCQAFIKDMDVKMDAFSKKYAAEITSRELENDIRSAKSKLHSAKSFLDKGVDEKAMSLLNELIGDLSNLESGMGASVAAVQDLSKVVQETRVEFANKLLVKESNNILRKGKSALSALRTTDDRALPLNDEQFGELCAVIEEFNENPLFMDIEAVKAFVGDAEAFAKKVGKSLKESSSGASGKGGGQDYKCLLLTLMGGTLWPKKLKVIPKIVMDTTINPSFYKDYTTINNGCEGINKVATNFIFFFLFFLFAKSDLLQVYPFHDEKR